MTVQIGKNLIKIRRVNSTNNYAIENNKDRKWQEGSIVLAEEQTDGRGQIDNTWESEPFKNLTFSLVLYPGFLPVVKQFQLSKMISVAIVEVLNTYKEGFLIKWPNDIYFKNKKIAGILIENSIMGANIKSSVLGVGLNVNQSEFQSDAPNPVSLSLILGYEISRDDLLNQLIRSIQKFYTLLFDGLGDGIDKNYLKLLYQFNTTCRYKDKNGVYNGNIIGVNEIGQLQIEDSDNILREYHFKEVCFL